MEMIAKEGFNPYDYISFFNLRSFDRIPLTQQIVNQEHNSGIDTVKADIALSLDLNGLESFGKHDVGVSSLPMGDPMDSLHYGSKTPSKAQRKQATQTNGLSEMFDWNDKTKPAGKQQKLDEVLSNFESAVQEGKVSDTVSQHGMMTGTNVFDERWDGDEKQAVKNFVSEELYIHTKVRSYMSDWNYTDLSS